MQFHLFLFLICSSSIPGVYVVFLNGEGEGGLLLSVPSYFFFFFFPSPLPSVPFQLRGQEQGMREQRVQKLERRGGRRGAERSSGARSAEQLVLAGTNNLPLKPGPARMRRAPRHAGIWSPRGGRPAPERARPAPHPTTLSGGCDLSLKKPQNIKR